MEKNAKLFCDSIGKREETAKPEHGPASLALARQSWSSKPEPRSKSVAQCVWGSAKMHMGVPEPEIVLMIRVEARAMISSYCLTCKFRALMNRIAP